MTYSPILGAKGMLKVERMLQHKLSQINIGVLLIALLMPCYRERL